MLRRLHLNEPWRSFEKNFWPETLPLGRRTVIYGHNGSGKSTLAELLLRLSEGEISREVTWEDEDSRLSAFNAKGTPSAPPVAVFTRKWVETNLSAFLDGANASAIVTLGSEAIGAKEEQAKLTSELATLEQNAGEANQKLNEANDQLDEIAREVQNQIISQLRAFDYVHFTKSRYSAPKIKSELSGYQSHVPSSESHAEALAKLAEDAPSEVASVASPPTCDSLDLNRLSTFLNQTPTRIAIQELEGNSIAQAWAEQGTAIHEDLDHCLYCSGELTSSRREQLARHFDESWLQIRSEAKGLLDEVSAEKLSLKNWYSTLPTSLNLASGVQSDYQDCFQTVKAQYDNRTAAFESLENVLNIKIADPSATPDVPDWSAITSEWSATALINLVKEHNDLAKRHTQITDSLKKTVLNHLIGSKAAAYQELSTKAHVLTSEKDLIADSVAEMALRLDELRQRQYTTHEMANVLTHDLALVYGKNHLSIAVTEDGKSYACRRRSDPATDLSEGERTTLSLLYFLRRLGDQQESPTDMSQRIVVIDDPSSSLDREAIFATHQWLIDTLKDFDQYVILTHDFSLLRLFLKSHKNAWGKSMSLIKKGDSNEIQFPKVSFLEMYACTVGGERSSKLAKLPRVLLNNTSEYSYLFSMVMAGIADTEDHERLFLLPNAARRVLEVFASYKAPHRTDFLQQLEALVASQEGQPFRDVYDFCNRYSHGEGSESINVLDARTVQGQIRRCMEFLRSIDHEHFTRMCTATETDPEAIA